VAGAPYAPEDGGSKYQVMFRAPAGEREEEKRMARTCPAILS
jgi:hypothetical protein